MQDSPSPLPKVIFLTTCLEDTEYIHASSLMSLMTGNWTLCAISAPRDSELATLGSGLGIPIVPVPESVVVSKTRQTPLRTPDESDIHIHYKSWVDRLRAYDADYAVLIDTPNLPSVFASIAARFILRLPENWPRVPVVERHGILGGDPKLTVPVYRDASVGAGFRIIASTKPVRIGAKDTSHDLQRKIGPLISKTLSKALERIVERGRKSGKTVRKLAWPGDEHSAAPIIDLKIDSHDRIRKVHRAFHGNPHFGFKVLAGDSVFEAIDIEVHKGDFPGKPGTVIARIQDCPVVRTREGCCVLLSERRRNPRNARFTPTQIKRLFKSKPKVRR